MKEFSFYQDSKVTCWECTHFTIIANNYEEAIAKIKQWQDIDMLNNQDKEVQLDRGEILYETAKQMSIEDNQGCSTIEIFDSVGNLIIANAKEQNNE